MGKASAADSGKRHALEDTVHEKMIRRMMSQASGQEFIGLIAGKTILETSLFASSLTFVALVFGPLRSSSEMREPRSGTFIASSDLPREQLRL